jgi:hypothetical protein
LNNQEDIPFDLLDDDDISDFFDADSNKEIYKKTDEVLRFTKLKAKQVIVKQAIADRMGILRTDGVRGIENYLKDDKVNTLFTTKTKIDEEFKTFNNTMVSNKDKRIAAINKNFVKPIVLYTSYPNGKGSDTDVKVTLDSIFENTKPTGFTLQKRSSDDVHENTKTFAATLVENLPTFSSGNFNSIESNPLTLLLFDENGAINYEVAEAVHAGINEYVLREASNLLGTDREAKDIAKLFGIDESNVSLEMHEALYNGGMTRKLAANDIGSNIIKNLGIEIKEPRSRNALATSFGISALQGHVRPKGETDTNKKYLLEEFTYFPTLEEKGRSYQPINAKYGISFVRGSENFFAGVKGVKKVNESIEGELSVDLTNERSYRKTGTGKYRVVKVHNSESQNAPKDHTDTVNTLENTPFVFNSGNAELLTMFSKNGKLDIAALVVHIIGSPDIIHSKDHMDSYQSQKLALERSLEGYLTAKADVRSGSLFFNWFIAKNHRIHLDSSNLNPQTDKQIARWLLTAVNSIAQIESRLVDAVISGDSNDMDAKSFAYAIVQAFAGNDGIFEIDKDNEKDVLASAKVILNEKSIEELYEMAKKSEHIGHAAVAIANIKKFKASNGTEFTSDLVFEVDGLTNGFGFRAMQFPVLKKGDGSGLNMEEWLEKVGVISPDSKNLGSLESMNGAKSLGQEDVYISVGGKYGKEVKKSHDKLSGTSLDWVDFFYGLKKLPNFSADPKDKEAYKTLTSFVRKLMKSPVMIFGYAAGIKEISSGLVNDQVMGKGYLKGQGLIEFLTEMKDNEYVISEQDLVDKFKEDGYVYHRARVALKTTSISDLKDSDIVQLKTDLNTAIDELYSEALKTTLDSLFGEQTAINNAFTTAGQFLFEGFKLEYNAYITENPYATKEEIMEWLKDNADILPGIAGASSDDQLTKLAFLKTVVDTDSDFVKVSIKGEKKQYNNTVSRTFGDPGVGPAVLTILSLDSSVLARTINKYYKDKPNSGALPVHDAMVIGAKEHGLINGYSGEFYTTNRRYSVAEEFIRSMDKFESNFKDKMDQITVFNLLKKEVNYDEARSSLNAQVSAIRAGRKKIFDQPKLKIGQMVGPNGTMHEVDLNKDKDFASNYLSDVAKQIIDTFNNNEVKGYFNEKDHKNHQKALFDMLEGCRK